ncbi:MAG: hypothetical protein ACYC4U_12825 [Pirellulaceae bacterium]
MECVNLKKMFGDRFKITWDESYFAEHGENARADDPWLQIIPCQHGHIYPYGGEIMVASTAKRGGVARELGQLDSTTMYRDGDDGVDVLFHVSNFEPVAQLMKPRRRRRLSPQQRQRLAALGRENLKRLRQVNVQAPSKAPEGEILVLAEPSAV